MYQEGLRLPPVRLTPEVEAVLLANSRTPDERRGDLDAQIGANRLGVERLAAFAGAPLDEVTAYGERRMRATLSALPDGSWSFSDVLDSCGPAADQQRPARISLTVTIDGEHATFDFAGTDDQRRGNVNAVEAVTVSAVSFALRAATEPGIPANGGAMRPVRVLAPAGSIVAARPPAAVGAGNVEVSQRVADVCLGALATPCADRVGAAGQGTMNNLLVGGAGWVYYETVAGGQGGKPSGPGMSGVHTAMTNTKNTPVEALERHYPMRVLRYRLRRGSGGDGRHPGGGHRARPAHARRRDGLPHHRAARLAAMGSCRRRTGRTRRELVVSRRRRAPRRTPPGQVHDPDEGGRCAADAHARRRRWGPPGVFGSSVR